MFLVFVQELMLPKFSHEEFEIAQDAESWDVTFLLPRVITKLPKNQIFHLKHIEVTQFDGNHKSFGFDEV
jgi:hypothetical protein